MRINGQHSSINIGSTSRLVFKYQKLVRKLSELFWIFINSNWEYFLPQYMSCGKPFAFHDSWTMTEHLHGPFL
jgi:hypothetical protein